MSVFVVMAATMLFPFLTFGEEESPTEVAVPGSIVRSGDLVEVSATEVIPGDLTVGCRTLRVSGEVRGSLLAGGVHLTIGNLIGRDITAGGYNVDLQATVSRDVLLAGANIEVDGTINGDLVAFGGNVTVLGNVLGNATIGGGNVEISGTINGSLDAQCGEMVIHGTVGRSVDLTASRLILSEKAVLKGNLAYTSNRSADIAEGAQIAGEVRRSAGRRMVLWRLASIVANLFPEQPGKWRAWRDNLPSWFGFLLRFSTFASLLLAGIIVLSLYQRHATTVADRIMSFPLRSLGLGLVFFVCAPICALILCSTVIGLPIGLAAFATYLVFSYISPVYVALAIGREILDRITKQDVRIIWPMVLGLFIIAALSSIPYYIGLGFRLICVLLGLGGMLMAGRRVRVAPRQEVI
jgi:cytoskeletal protein CcmA (bactofilin family)